MHTIYNKGDASEWGNYRRMLSVPSKILEALVCEGLDEFISDRGLLSNTKWGFRAGRSTEGLLIHLTEIWKQALNHRQVGGYFQKAFDTVSHTILRYKLEAIGITRDLPNWMISYLTNREQFAIVKGCTSQTRNVSCGMPQCSLLGRKASTPSSATLAVRSNAFFFEIGPAITNYHVPIQVQDHCHNHENQNVSAVRVPLKHPLVMSGYNQT